MSSTMPQLFVNEETLKQRFLPGMAVLTNTVHGRWLMGEQILRLHCQVLEGDVLQDLDMENSFTKHPEAPRSERALCKGLPSR